MPFYGCIQVIDDSRATQLPKGQFTYDAGNVSIVNIVGRSIFSLSRIQLLMSNFERLNADYINAGEVTLS